MRLRALITPSMLLLAGYAYAGSMDVNPVDQGGQFAISETRSDQHLTLRTRYPAAETNQKNTTAQPASNNETTSSSAPQINVVRAEPPPTRAPLPDISAEIVATSKIELPAPSKVGSNVYVDSSLTKIILFPAPPAVLPTAPTCVPGIALSTLTVCFDPNESQLTSEQQNVITRFTDTEYVIYVDVYSHDADVASIRTARSRIDAMQSILRRAELEKEVHYLVRVGRDCLTGCGDRAVIRIRQPK